VSQKQALQSAADEARKAATIPGGYTDSFYPLEYYFEVSQPDGVVLLYAGFLKELTNQPYFLARKG
jgi:hypothetical protein